MAIKSRLVNWKICFSNHESNLIMIFMINHDLNHKSKFKKNGINLAIQSSQKKRSRLHKV
jgi:fatty acid desaturase